MVSNICFFDSYLKKKWCSLTKYYISTGLKPTSKLPNILMNSLFYQYRTGFEILGTLQPLQNTLCVRISSRKKQKIFVGSLCFWIDTSWKETSGWQFFLLVGWAPHPNTIHLLGASKGKSLRIHHPISRVVVNTQNLPAFPPLRMSLMENIWKHEGFMKAISGGAVKNE